MFPLTKMDILLSGVFCATVKLTWFKSNVAHYSLVSFPLVLECCGRIVIWCFILQVKCLETTARWSGVSAPTAFTCTASWNGWTHSKCSSNAPCADRNGSLRSEGVEHSCLTSLLNYSVFVLYIFLLDNFEIALLMASIHVWILKNPCFVFCLPFCQCACEFLLSEEVVPLCGTFHLPGILDD